MNEYKVFFIDGRTLTVWGPSLTHVANRYPKANVFDWSNLGKYVARYLPN